MDTFKASVLAKIAFGALTSVIETLRASEAETTVRGCWGRRAAINPTR